MADSKTATDSMTALLDNGFDPPDVLSAKVSTEENDGEGDVSGTSKKDAEQKKIDEEVKGLVVEEKGLEDLNDGLDKKDVENENKDVGNENKDVGNENNVEINVSFDENKELGSTKDCEEKKDVLDIVDLEDSEHGEEMENKRGTREVNEKKGSVETMHHEGHSDANGAKDVEEKKEAGEPNEMEIKSDVGQILGLEGQIDAKEAKEGEKNKDVVNEALDEEKVKGFREAKGEKGEKVFEETKCDDDKIVVEEQMEAEENDVAEVMEDIGGKNNLQSSGNLKDNHEKNYVSDVKGSEQKQVKEVKFHKDDNAVEKLKYGKNKQTIQGIDVEEQKRDLDGENDGKNNLKPVVSDKRVKSKKKPKNIGKVEAEVGKKKITVDENEEAVASRRLEDEKDDIAEAVHISQEDVSAKEDDDGDIEKKSSNRKVEKSFKRKRGEGQRSDNKSEVKDKSKAKAKKGSGKKTKELMSTSIDVVSSPIGSSRERPVRERKTVERLVEVIEKEPNKAVLIEKGRGTPLKDIPNVAYKLARKKPADLKFLHQTLFGRRGKVVDFKSNILQFSGFAWHEAEEKQRAKIKEKLDKCVKDNLLDICDLLDLTVSKTSTKKEEIIIKLADFLEAPYATTDIILMEREQSEKSRKRKRFSGSGSRSSGSTPAKRPRKRSVKAEGTQKSSGKNPQDTEDEDVEENSENGVSDEDEAPRHSESDAKENESSEASDDDGENEYNDKFGKGKKDTEHSHKKRSSAIVAKRSNSNKKVSSEMQVKSPVKTPSSYKHLKVKRNDTGEKVFTRKKKKGSESPELSDDEGDNEDAYELGTINQDIKQSPKRHSSSISSKKKRMGSNSKKASSQTVAKSPVKPPSSHKQAKVEKDDTGEKVFTRKRKDSDSIKKSNSKLSSKDSSSGKKSGKGKATGQKRKSGPSKTDLRKTICEILKEVDFNTATFTDILKNLAAHYKMDLTPKKASIKQLIQEELTKMAEEAEDSEDEGEKEDVVKEENPKPLGKKVKA